VDDLMPGWPGRAAAAALDGGQARPYFLVFVITIGVNLPASVVLCLSANWVLIECE
jgi:hypothetical protein